MASLNVELNQAAEFFGRFERFGGTKPLLKQLLSDDERMRSWVRSLITSVAASSYSVSVDRSLSLVQMIEAGGYDNRKDAVRFITEECFPVDRSGELMYEKELFLVPPSRDGITTTEWKAELEANGWELEQVPELLALGAKHPDLQREYFIIAFGSSWRDPDGSLYSPELWSDRGKRRAGTDWCSPDCRWNLRVRALVSRKRR